MRPGYQQNSSYQDSFKNIQFIEGKLLLGLWEVEEVGEGQEFKISRNFRFEFSRFHCNLRINIFGEVSFIWILKGCI